MEKRKSIIFKDVTDKGIVVAAFATLNVIDKHGDVTLPGFFGKQTVSMLPAHAWGHVTIGKGNIHESGDQAIAELKMNLDIPAAKDWHSALLFDMKNGEPLQEWSYGFDILSGGSSPGDQDGHHVRFLGPAPDGSPGSKVHEVSPVLVGAGEDTATLAIKGAKFGDELDAVLAAVDGIMGRAKSLAEMRVKQGRGLSTDGLLRIKSLGERLSLLGIDLKDLMTDDDARKRAQQELRRLKMQELGRRAGVKFQISKEQ